jgi:GTP-binding protein HflX
MTKGIEMQDLAKAAGYEVVAELEFRKFHKMNYITDTIYEKLDFLIQEHNIECVLLNEPVSIRHMRKLEDHFDDDEKSIIDKTMLILEIFDKKASSSEIQLQIKFAKLKYSEPRMRTVVGETLRTEKQARDRGAGETMQQIMKSDMRGRISKYEKQLKELMDLKQAEPDDIIPKLPIMGYYSIGKTTLFNILTSSDRETSQDAFTTMFMKSSWSRVAGYPVEIIDTIGLVDLPPAVIDAFALMLQSVFSSDILMLGLDASAGEDQFKDQLNSLMEYFGKFAIEDQKYKIIYVLTKCDLTEEETYSEYSKLIDEIADDTALLSSYEILGVRSDKPELVRKSFVRILDMMLEKDLISFEYQGLNQSEVSLIHDHARVIDELWKDGRLNITGIIPKQSLLKNLGNLKDKLLTEIEDEIEELEANEPDFTDFRNFEE